MGYLLNVLFAFATLGAFEAGFETGWRQPWLVLPLALVPYAAGWLARRARPKPAETIFTALSHFAPVGQLVAVCALGWPATVEELFGRPVSLFAWPHPVLLLGLLPYAALELFAIDARARILDRRPATVRAARRLQTRMALSAFVPLVLYVLVSSAVGYRESVRVHVEGIALLNGAFAALLLVFFGLALPTLLRHTWDTAPLAASWTRELLEGTARRAGFRCRELLVWRTGNLMANAAIVGFAARQRIVLFSDALLAQLAPDELAAVFAHEIGHARRHHALVFGAWAVGCFLIADVAIVAFDVESIEAQLALLGGLVLLWYFSFGYLSRRFELEADLTSVEVLGSAEPLVRALERVGGAHARRKTTWRHFSVADRVGFLASVERDPGLGRTLKRRLRLWSVGGVVLLLTALAGELWFLGSSLDQDRVLVDLRLGRYAEAAARVRAGADVEDELRAAVEHGAGLSTGEPLESIAERARAALEAGDREAAEAFLDLAYLRDDAQFVPVREALDLVEAGDRAGALRRAADESPEWQRSLARFLARR